MGINIMYLTEDNLVNYLNIIYPGEVWIHNKRLPGYRFIPDYRNDKLKLIIEFDGYQHYTQAKVINNDYRKDKIYSQEGYKVVRIPYFVQMESRTILHLFEKVIDIPQSYPHGFISDKSTLILPCDFCELGIIRFKSDLDKFSYIKNEILDSLKQKSNKLGIENTLPPSLFDL